MGVPKIDTLHATLRYANTKMPSATTTADSSSVPGGVDAATSAGGAPSGAAGACYAVDDDASSQLAKEELNLLAKLIGGNEADGGGKDTFKLNLFDICGGGGGAEKHA